MQIIPLIIIRVLSFVAIPYEIPTIRHKIAMADNVNVFLITISLINTSTKNAARRLHPDRIIP